LGSRFTSARYIVSAGGRSSSVFMQKSYAFTIVDASTKFEQRIPKGRVRCSCMRVACLILDARATDTVAFQCPHVSLAVLSCPLNSERKAAVGNAAYIHKRGVEILE